jgi:cytochrome c oxidase subunit IV
MTDHTTGDIHNQVVEDHFHETSTKSIWTTFWILLLITVFEVAIAFTSIPFSVLKVTYITLTLVKAYFIVFNFMHLKHEKSIFSKIIILPFLLIVYLIFMSLHEGTAIRDLTVFINNY